MKRLLLTLGATVNVFIALGQANSVELRDGGSSLLSAHNSIASAYAAIPPTVTQPYLIEITAAYTAANEMYPITFSGKTGTTATNTITLRPAAGVSLVTVPGNTNGKILVLDNVNYHILDGRAGGTGTGQNLKIQNLASGASAYTVELINGSCFNTLEYLHLVGGSGSSAGARVIHLGPSATNPTGNSDNVIRFCEIQGSRSGIYFGGTAANKNTNNLVYGCKIYNWTFAGVWLQSNTGTVVVDSCQMWETAPSSTGPTAILASAFDNGTFSRNHIYDLQYSGTVKGIAVSNTGISNVYNNFISLTQDNPTTTTLHGIEYTGSGLQTAQVINNTIRIGGVMGASGTSGNVVSAASLKSNSNAASTYLVQNNIFVNERTGGNTGTQHVVTNVSSTAGTINADNNTYNASATGYIGRIATTAIPTFAAYQQAVTPLEVNSNDAQVQFVSNTDLHLAGTSIGNPMLMGIAHPAVTVDIDNEVRAATPYRGGDEYNTPLSADLLFFTAKVVSTNAVLSWELLTDNLATFEPEYSADGSSYTRLNSLPATSQQRKYTYTDDGRLEAEGYHYYRLKLTGNDGRYYYSSIAVLNRVGVMTDDMYVVPNPLTSRSSLVVNYSSSAPAEVVVTNVSGTVVYRSSLTLNAGVNAIPLSAMGEQSAGVYLLRVQVKDEVYRLTVLKY